MQTKSLPRLLLIDDDPVLCTVLSGYLEAQGFGVTQAGDGETGLRLVAEGGYDLVILDQVLPGLQGIEVLRHIRSQGDLPVLMLTGSSDDVDRIVALEMGADDYLSKSCNLRELAARLRAILRRTRNAAVAEQARRDDFDNLIIYPSERYASWRGAPLPLTSTEFDLLELLFNSPGKAISKAELAMRVLGRELTSFDRSLDMHISNLRKKMGRLSDGRSPIQTVHRAGYQLLQK